MMKILRLVCCSWLCLLAYQGLSQSKNDACYTQLMAYIEKMGSIDKPEGKQVYYYKVKIQNIADQEDKKILSVMRIETLVAKDKMIYKSPVTSAFVDTKETYVIYPERKLILRGNTPENTDENVQETQFTTIQKAVLDSCTFISCTEVVEGKLSYRVLRFEASDRLKSAKNISSMQYYLDAESGDVKKMSIYYLPDSYLKQQIYTYERVDLNYRKERVYPIRAYLFDQAGELLPHYKNYSLIDNYSEKN